MKWFYMQAGAMPLLIAALAALYLRPGNAAPRRRRTTDGSITTGTATMSITTAG